MRQLLYAAVLLMMSSCSNSEKVLYEELTPAEFTERLEECPVAYLPLGTIEWHSNHLPLGSDGIQSEEFFKMLAKEAGGIVMPKLFLGPDFDTIITGNEFYGMDCGRLFSGQCVYDIQQLPGSAYWISDSTFGILMDGIMKQLSRAGFKMVIAHGHGPSTNFIGNHAEEFQERYNLKVLNCWGNDTADLCLMCDHAAANETSIMKYFRPELVKMNSLPGDKSQWPLGMMGEDPRTKASSRLGKDIVFFEIQKMKAIIHRELNKQ